jgi:hypothetical protein
VAWTKELRAARRKRERERERERATAGYGSERERFVVDWRDDVEECLFVFLSLFYLDCGYWSFGAVDVGRMLQLGILLLLTFA